MCTSNHTIEIQDMIKAPVFPRHQECSEFLVTAFSQLHLETSFAFQSLAAAHLMVTKADLYVSQCHSVA